jgi:hypothetical protein
VKAIDLDTAKPFTVSRQGAATTVKLDVPITDDRQSAHIKLTGTVADGSYKVVNGDLVFDRTLRGLRNTVLLPAGWDVTAVSQSGTIGTYQDRAFVALINLNAENSYKVTIHARQSASARESRELRRDGRALPILDLWERGRPAFGIYAPNENPGPRGEGPRKAVYTKAGGEKLAANPLYDFVFLNLEGAYDAEAIKAMADGLRGTTSTGRKALIVRIPSIDSEGAAVTKRRVKEALDLGADGITIPHVTGVE